MIEGTSTKNTSNNCEKLCLNCVAPCVAGRLFRSPRCRFIGDEDANHDGKIIIPFTERQQFSALDPAHRTVLSVAQVVTCISFFCGPMFHRRRVALCGILDDTCAFFELDDRIAL